jgi:hypothetical protein
VKKAGFRLETRFFSSSIRSASESARFPLVINQLLEGNSIMATAKKAPAKKAALQRRRLRQESRTCEEGRSG